MPQYKINVFYLISIICMLLMIGFMWFVYLPSFEGFPVYEFVKNLSLVITILFSIAIILTLLRIRIPTEEE